MQARRRPWFALLLACALAGCHQVNVNDSPLFMPGRDGADKDNLTKPDGIKQTSATEVSTKKSPPPPPVPAAAVKRLTLGPRTSGHDSDEQPGDEALQVALEPRDATDQIVPIHGNLRITALQISADGSKSILCSWDVPAEQLRDEWRSARTGSGYFLVLPWKAWPKHERLRVVAQLTLNGPRTLEVDRDICVQLALPQPAPAPQPPAVQPVGHTWQAQPLAEAVRLLRPQPLREGE